jgi:hypothetical protein
MYSVIAPEWSAVKDRLAARLRGRSPEPAGTGTEAKA